jgi:hypothetical protein
VLLNAEAYAEVIDQHVELATELDALRSLLDYFEPTDDDRWRRRESQSNPAVQWIPEPEHEGEAPGANRPRASRNRLSGDSAPAHALPNLQRSGHQAAVTP